MNPSAAPGTTTVVDIGRRSSGPRLSVALVRPASVVMVRTLSMVGPIPPIGLAYIAGVARSHGHTVQVVDAPGEGLDLVEDFETCVGTLRRVGLDARSVVDALADDTQVVGLTHMFLHEWPEVREVAQLARQRFPEALIVVGGENATAFWPWMFAETDAIDVVVLGEGEATFAELLERHAAGECFADLEGLVVSDPAERGAPHLPKRLRDLSTIPRPAWDLFPIDEYLEHRSFFGVDRGRTMPILGTRGCPYKCSFCSSPQMWTVRYNVRDPEDVVDEIAHNVSVYGIENVDFLDLTAVTKRSWILGFCDALDARGLSINWQLPVGTRTEVIDHHVLRRMQETGCRNLTFAPEHGSPHMLEVYDKRVDLDHVLDSIAFATRAGMVVHVNTVIGHPAETPHDRWLNLRFLVRAAWAGCHTTSTIRFHPYPGSRDFQELLDAGKLRVDEDFLYDGLARGAPSGNRWNEGVSSRRLYLSQISSVLVFIAVAHLRHPGRILRSVRVLFGRSAETNHLEQAVKTKLSDGPLGYRRRPVVAR